MKTIGLVGGMSWQSTALYYRIINETFAQLCGADHSAPIVMYSVDFAPLRALQCEERWLDVAHYLGAAALHVEKAGADFLLLCANTAHVVGTEIEQSLSIPLIHIADPVAEEIKRHGVVSVGLLGTRFTMEKAFFKERLASKYGFRVVVPEKSNRNTVDRIIYEELCCGKILESSRAAVVEIIAELETKGTEGIILGVPSCRC